MLKNLIQLFKFRALIATLILRELKARYRGSIFGFFWSFLNPLLLMLVYVLVFSIYLRVEMANYAVFLFCGLLPWLWFSSSLGHAAASIIGGGSLIKRVFFPAEILPFVAVLSAMANYILSLPLLFLFLFYFKIPLSFYIFFLPIIIIIQLFFTLGIALVLASLNVHLRDIEQILSNILILWFFLSPVLYPVSTVPERFRFFYMFNPMAVMMESYQNIFFYAKNPNWINLAIVAIISMIGFFIGYHIFDLFRDSLAEEI